MIAKTKRYMPFLYLALIVMLWVLADFAPSKPVSAADWTVTGRLLDPQDSPVPDAEVSLILYEEDETPLAVAESQENGTYVLPVNGENLDFSEAFIEFERPHFEGDVQQLTSEQRTLLDQGQSVTIEDITLERSISLGFWVAALTFVAMLIMIATEVLHNTLTALLAVAVIFVMSTVGAVVNHEFFVFGFETALKYVDFEVIFLLLGMMIVIGVIEETGIFQWLAYQAYRLSRGKIWLLAVILMALTSVASALLDNVTTMLLMSPIILQIALALRIDPLSLLLPAVLSSNVGGITTLVGTPTNILIGSYAGIGFNDFLVNLTPGVLIALGGLIGYVLLRFRKEYRSSGGEISSALLERLEKNAQIENPHELRKAGIVFGILLLLFVFGESFHLAPVMAAIIGAAAMLIWVNPDIEEMLTVVDWTTLVFFISMFIVIGAVQEVGLISQVAGLIQQTVRGNLTASIFVIVWVSAIMSGVVANIPFTAAMLPVVNFLTRTTVGAEGKVLFYSLSVGAAMGGNTSLIGASANLVTAGIAERGGYPITFKRFFLVGFPAMLITVGLGTLWLLIRF